MLQKSENRTKRRKKGYAPNAMLLACARPRFYDVCFFSDVATRRNRGRPNHRFGAYIEDPSDAKADSGGNSSAIRGWLLSALRPRKSPAQKPAGSHLRPSVFIILYGYGRERRWGFWVDFAAKVPKLRGVKAEEIWFTGETWIQSQEYAIAQKRDYNCYRHVAFSRPAF